jgi:predicted esterase
VQQTARWFTIGAEPSSCEEIIIILHGYGQHPAFMLDGLKDLITPTRCICAPEGLSRFYVSGFEGRVGASWMTRDERSTDINDHLAYLNQWWQHLHVPASAVITLIGFSQGVATASRWLASGFAPDSAIFHSGTLPAEWKSEQPVFSDRLSEIVSIRGSSDTIYSAEAHREAATFFENTGLNFETTEVEGTHKMKAEHLIPYL